MIIKGDSGMVLGMVEIGKDVSECKENEGFTTLYIEDRPVLFPLFDQKLTPDAPEKFTPSPILTE